MIRLIIIQLMLLLMVPETQGKGWVHSCEYVNKQSATTSLACNLYFEARSHKEGVVGLYAVAFVTMNRVNSLRYPDTVQEVVYQKAAFSWSNDGLTDRVYNRVSWLRCLSIAKVVLSIEEQDHGFYDITKGSLFYHSTKVTPYWSDEQYLTVKINNHIFYNNDRKK